MENVYEVKSAGEGKGLGVFATRKIQQGEIILHSDAKLMAKSYEEADQEIYPQFVQLESGVQNDILHLSNCFCNQPKLTWEEGDTDSDLFRQHLTQIFHTNCSYITHLDQYVLCVLFSRLNHACKPNCAHVYSRISHRKTVRATQDISDGEELTINYLNAPEHWFLDSVDRIAELQHLYNFKCCCAMCMIHPQQPQVDSMLQQCGRLFSKLNSKVHSFHTQENILRQLTDIVEQLDLSVLIQEFCHRSLFLFYCTRKDLQSAQKHAEKCQHMWGVLHGSASFQFRCFSYLSQSPFSCFGEVENEFGSADLTEHDEMVMCGIIEDNQLSTTCRNCSQSALKASYSCPSCKLVSYCTAKCKQDHFQCHLDFCRLSSQF